MKFIRNPNELSHIDVFNALITMIKWTRQFKNNPDFIKKTISPLSYAKEFSTIRFQLPRGSGHSFFIKKLLLSYGPEGSLGKFIKTPALIFPNTTIMQNLGFNPKWKWVGTPKSNFRGYDFDSVIIDCSSLLSSKDIESIYNSFIHLLSPNFVYLFME